MGISIAEKHPLGHDHGASSANAQEIQHAPDEEQFTFVGYYLSGLFTLQAGLGKDGTVQVCGVHRACEGWIGQNHIVMFGRD